MCGEALYYLIIELQGRSSRAHLWIGSKNTAWDRDRSRLLKLRVTILAVVKSRYQYLRASQLRTVMEHNRISSLRISSSFRVGSMGRLAETQVDCPSKGAIQVETRTLPTGWALPRRVTKALQSREKTKMIPLGRTNLRHLRC